MKPGSGFITVCLSIACLFVPPPPLAKAPCRPGVCKPIWLLFHLMPTPQNCMGVAFQMYSFPWWGWVGISQTPVSSDTPLRWDSQMVRKWNLIPHLSGCIGLVTRAVPPTLPRWVTGNQRQVKKRWMRKEVGVVVNCLIALTKYTTKAFKEGIAHLGSQFKDIYHGG